nr:MAG TPA: hypothetical protein [Bacteriophage sp.]
MVKWDYPEGFAEQPKTFTSGTLTVRLDEDQMAQLCVMFREQMYEAMSRIWGTQ